ncbi:hypothetical protein PspLS_08881, partial [Pyricularia sp. CBS 133598]
SNKKMTSSNQERQRQHQQAQAQAQQQPIYSWPERECCGHFADAYGNFSVPRTCDNEMCNMRGVPYTVSSKDHSAVQTATIRSSSGSSAGAPLRSQLKPTATDSPVMNKHQRLPPMWAGQAMRAPEDAESPEGVGRDVASTGSRDVKVPPSRTLAPTRYALHSLTYAPRMLRNAPFPPT